MKYLNRISFAFISANSASASRASGRSAPNPQQGRADHTPIAQRPNPKKASAVRALTRRANSAHNPPTAQSAPPRPHRRAARIALTAVLALIAAAAAFTTHNGIAAQTVVDYDADDDGLIEVTTLDQLRVMDYDRDNGNGNPDSRWTGATQLAEYNAAFPNRDSTGNDRMGCPASGGCTGYELSNDLNFDTNGDGNVNASDSPSYPNWEGYWDMKFTLEGNGHAIFNLRSQRNRAGLVQISKGATIRNLGLINPILGGSSTQYAGLVGESKRDGGVDIINCYVRGGSATSSYSAGTAWLGGIIGLMASGSISSSWSTMDLSSSGQDKNLAGLSGGGGSQTINHSYYAGTITLNSGTNTPEHGAHLGTVTSRNVYWDTTESPSLPDDGNNTSPEGRTTAQLQSPTGYTGPYANWRTSVDVRVARDAWDFGTNSEYPVLKVGGHDVRLQRTGARAAIVRTDYDTDNDNLIDITTLAQLDVVRHDLDGNGAPVSGGATAYGEAFPNRQAAASGRMGCPGTCSGYELLNDLDFDTDDDGDVDSDDDISNFAPIGGTYSATFNGRNFVIKNMTMSNADQNAGFIDTLSGTVLNLGLTDVSVTNTRKGAANSETNVGVIVGQIASGGAVRASFATGTVASQTSADSNPTIRLGGFVGHMAGGSVTASWSGVNVSIQDRWSHSGGFVGYMESGTTITAAYATGSVSGAASYKAGFGNSAGGSTITASYATGSVSGAGSHLRGFQAGIAFGTVTNSYWDSQTTGQTQTDRGGSPQTTSNLKTPTGYTGIYENWNVNVDGSAGNDDPWDFGSSDHYPRLKFSGMDLTRQLQGDYDIDDDQYIDIYNLDQLNAIRYDLDATGGIDTGVSDANADKFRAAYPDGLSRLGCPAAGCLGYELRNSLDFDADGDDDVDSDDPYPTWIPIGPTYSGSFKGNNLIIENLTITASSTNRHYGLFQVFSDGDATAAQTLSGLGLVDVSVSVSGASHSPRVGPFAADFHETLDASFATGTATVSATSTHAIEIGGLVALLIGGEIKGSWADVNITASTTGSGDIKAGGAAARAQADSSAVSTIIASYAKGPVSAANSTGDIFVGGLLADSDSGAHILTACYASGAVSGSTGSSADSNVGGLLAENPAAFVAANNYFDTDATGQAASTSTLSGVQGKTTAQLLAPDGYNGIYAAWNVDLDAAEGADDPWVFTPGWLHPRLKYGGIDPFQYQVGTYDSDGDRLAEIYNLDQLNAVRWDLDGNGSPDSAARVTAANRASFAAAFPHAPANLGCASSCQGYELVQHLDFDANNDGDVDANDPYPNWEHIGIAASAAYSGRFDGNSRTISNLTIDVSDDGGALRAGLFGFTSGLLENLGLLDVSITVVQVLPALGTPGRNDSGTVYIGALTGRSDGSVRNCYSTGSVSYDGDDYYNWMGGLVGILDENQTIDASWSSVDVTMESGRFYAGGLVGEVRRGATVRASYATGAVSGTQKAGGFAIFKYTGGLVAFMNSASGSLATIEASYAAGAVTHSSYSGGGGGGGLYGGQTSTAPTITNAYWDTEASGMSDDADATNGVGYTTAELKGPRAYSGIYANWNVNVDGSAGNDDPWHFGTADTYPRLKFRGMSLNRQLLGDYDQDNDRLAEIYTLDQLNAVRWDLNADGALDSGGDSAQFSAAWLDAADNLGCAASCQGYELAADLDFDADSSGSVDANDPYPNWTPIGDASNAYAGSFNGNNNVISNLKINSSERMVGFFGRAAGEITGLALADVDIDWTYTGATFSPDSVRGVAGAIVGETTAAVRSSYATGNIDHTGVGNTLYFIGGLVGRSQTSNDAIAASWADVDIASSGAHARAGGVAGSVNGKVAASFAAGEASITSATAQTAGLVANMNSASSNITASYATGNLPNSTGDGVLAANTNGTIVSSYWDTQTTTKADDADNTGEEGKTTNELQDALNYTGIYADWNVDVDGAAGNDDPWEFSTGDMYPLIKHNGMDLAAQANVHASGDYDLDGDRLAEIYTLEQLNSLRYDLDGNGAATGAANIAAFSAAWPDAASNLGCASSSCQGYELAAELDFDRNGDGAVDRYDPYPSWFPIGHNDTSAYTSEFKGNNRLIRNLTIRGTPGFRIGLFGTVRVSSSSPGIITGVGLPDVDIDVEGLQNYADVGALAAYLLNGTVRSSWSTGKVSAASSGGINVGGLVGAVGGASGGGTIAASWSSAATTSVGAGSTAGGLVGQIGTSAGSDVIASYAIGPVSGVAGAGGLAGGITNNASSTITASYATGPVSASGSGSVAHGLVAESHSTNTFVVTNSYWDTGTTGIATNTNNAAAGRTTVALQTPEAYGTQSTDIYMGWNVNVDGSTGADDPWNFGTMMQYPMLKFDGMSLVWQGSLAMGTSGVHASENKNIPTVGEEAGTCLTTGPRLRGSPPTSSWIWQRSSDAITWTDIARTRTLGVYRPSYRHTITSSDVGNYLRACIDVVDTHETEGIGTVCTRILAPAQN